MIKTLHLMDRIH